MKSKDIFGINVLLSITKHDYNSVNATANWIEAALPNIHDFSAEELSVVICHLGDVGYYDDDFFKNWLIQARNKAFEFTSEDLSRCIYGLAKCEIYDEELMGAIRNSFINSGREYNPEQLFNIIWGAEKLGLYNDDFLNKWVSLATNQLSEFSSEQLSQSLLSLTKSGHYNNFFLASTLSEINRRINNFSNQDLAKVSYSLAMLKVNNNIGSSSLENMVVSLLNKCDLAKVTNIKEKNQLITSFDVLSEDARLRSIEMPSKWKDEIKRESDITISYSQKKLAEYIKKQGVELEEEYWIDGVGSVDIYIPATNMVVQFDGPTHFHRDNNKGQLVYNARTKFNGFRIASKGYGLVRVAYNESCYHSDILEQAILRAKEVQWQEWESQAVLNAATAELSINPSPKLAAKAKDKTPKTQERKNKGKAKKDDAKNVNDDFDLILLEEAEKNKGDLSSKEDKAKSTAAKNISPQVAEFLKNLPKSIKNPFLKVSNLNRGDNHSLYPFTYEIIKYLKNDERYKKAFFARNEVGLNNLEFAADRGNVEAISSYLILGTFNLREELVGPVRGALIRDEGDYSEAWKALLAKNLVDPNGQDFILLCSKNKCAAVEVFLDYGADPNLSLPMTPLMQLLTVENSSRKSAFVEAIERIHTTIIDKSFTKEDICDIEPICLLMAERTKVLSCKKDYLVDRIECLKLLIDRGARVNGFFGSVEDGEKQLKIFKDKNLKVPEFTPRNVPLLSEVVKLGSIEAIELFLTNGANPNVINEEDNNKTPLHSSIEQGLISVARNMVLKYGADLYAQDKDGNDALFFAVKNCFPIYIKAIASLSSEANKNFSSKAFEFAVKHQKIVSVKALLACGEGRGLGSLESVSPVIVEEIQIYKDNPIAYITNSNVYSSASESEKYVDDPEAYMGNSKIYSSKDSRIKRENSVSFAKDKAIALQKILNEPEFSLIRDNIQNEISRLTIASINIPESPITSFKKLDKGFSVGRYEPEAKSTKRSSYRQKHSSCLLNKDAISEDGKKVEAFKGVDFSGNIDIAVDNSTTSKYVDMVSDRSRKRGVDDAPSK